MSIAEVEYLNNDLAASHNDSFQSSEDNFDGSGTPSPPTFSELSGI